jgi:hypothetical protein
MSPTPESMTANGLEIDDDRRLLLRIVEEAYHQSTWNDTNLRSSLQNVTPEQAGWRPPLARHNIAELVLHSAYWKFAVRKRLTDDPDASFPIDGEDWFDVDGPIDPERWNELLTVIDDEHRTLCDAIRQCERKLDYASTAGRELVRKLFGVAMHDTYHTGQIHLILAQHQRSQAG